MVELLSLMTDEESVSYALLSPSSRNLQNTTADIFSLTILLPYMYASLENSRAHHDALHLKLYFDFVVAVVALMQISGRSVFFFFFHYKNGV